MHVRIHPSFSVWGHANLYSKRLVFCWRRNSIFWFDTKVDGKKMMAWKVCHSSYIKVLLNLMMIAIVDFVKIWALSSEHISRVCWHLNAYVCVGKGVCRPSHVYCLIIAIAIIAKALNSAQWICNQTNRERTHVTSLVAAAFSGGMRHYT